MLCYIYITMLRIFRLTDKVTFDNWVVRKDVGERWEYPFLTKHMHKHSNMLKGKHAHNVKRK